MALDKRLAEHIIRKEVHRLYTSGALVSDLSSEEQIVTRLLQRASKFTDMSNVNKMLRNFADTSKSIVTTKQRPATFYPASVTSSSPSFALPTSIDVGILYNLEKAAAEGDLDVKSPDEIYSIAQIAQQRVDSKQLSFPRAVRSAISTNRRRQKLSPTEARLAHIEDIASAQMSSFFPEYSPSDAHAKRSLLSFDTETADRNQDIIEIAGVRVVFNKDKNRFERIEAGSEKEHFHRFYAPKKATFGITQGVHGYNWTLLHKIRGKVHATYSDFWNEGQLEAFQRFSGDSVQVGYNILNADLAWIHNRPSQGFEMAEASYKKSFLDIYHLAETLRGKGKEGHNTLQNIAEEYGVSSAQLGIPAHAGWADSVVALKVLEELFRRFPDHPAVKEFKAALDSEAIVHSHTKENPDPLHNSGMVVHTIGKGSAGAGFFTNDIPAALGVSAQDLADGKAKVEDYLEDTSMMTESQWEDTWLSVEEKRELIKLLNASGKSSFNVSDLGSKDKDKLIKYLRNELREDGKGWDDPALDTASIAKTPEVDAIFRLVWSDTASDEFKKKMIKTALLENAQSYVPTWQRIADKVAEIEDAYSGNYLGLPDLTGEAFYQDLITTPKDDLNSNHIRQFNALFARWKKQKQEEKKLRKQQQAQADKEAQQKQLEEEKRQEALRREEQNYSDIRAYNIGLDIEQAGNRYEDRRKAEHHWERYRRKNAHLLFGGDIDKLSLAAAEGTKKYSEALEEVIDRNKKVLEVTNKMSKIPIYNPLQLLSTVDSQYGGIRHAAHGILPGFMEKPVFRFFDAIKNQWNTWEADVTAKWNIASSIGKAVGGALGGAAGTLIAPGAGTVVGVQAGVGVAGAISQIAGNTMNAKMVGIGEGIQHRLNLLGMVTTGISGFISALRTAAGLLGKLSSLWSYMPSYTLSTLTGIRWGQAQPLQAADRWLGFQAGTLHSNTVNLALQQAGLYTSGAFNEKALVAASRLGIFNLAYAPMGGNAQEQERQLINRLYNTLYNSGLSKAQMQSTMSLINDYNPSYLSILEKMHVSGYSDYAQITSNRGYGFLNEAQNTRVARVALDWDMAQRSFRDAFSLAGARVYDFAQPLVKAFNTVLWQFANGQDIDWDMLSNELNKAWKKVQGFLDNVDWKSLDIKGKLQVLNPLWDEILQYLNEHAVPVFLAFINNLITELRNIKLRADIPGLLKDLILTGGANFSKYFELVTTESMAQETSDALASSLASRSSTAKWMLDSGHKAGKWSEDGIHIPLPVTWNTPRARELFEHLKTQDSWAKRYGAMEGWYANQVLSILPEAKAVMGKKDILYEDEDLNLARVAYLGGRKWLDNPETQLPTEARGFAEEFLKHQLEYAVEHSTQRENLAHGFGVSKDAIEAIVQALLKSWGVAIEVIDRTYNGINVNMVEGKATMAGTGFGGR